MSSSKKQRVPRKVLPHHVLQKKTYALHAHAVQEVLSVLEVTEDGLSEAEAAEQLLTFGPNAFTETKQVSVFSQIFDQLKSPLAFVLLLAFGITTVLKEYVDAGVILFALLIAVVVGVLQEGKASRAFQKLSESQVKTANVVRDGKRHEIMANAVVPGDIVIIQNGMHVPADMRLIRTKKLSINEASLTGEWIAVQKNIAPVPVGTLFVDQTNMAWMGTFVASGQGMGVVVATGDNTSIGQLASDVQDITETETPLQYEMKKISKIMLYLIGAIVLVIFLIGIWGGMSIHDMLLLSIAIAVAAVPEGLPAAVTIILAVGMESLLKRGGLVRNLLAAETLGSTTYILTDKTGTLTEAKMSVTGIILSDCKDTKKEDWGSIGRVRELFDVSLCATDAYIDEGEKQTVRGDSEEVSILKVASDLDISIEGNSLRGRRIDQLAFTSEKRFAAGLSRTQGSFRLCVNGSPSKLLKNATRVLGRDGVEEMTDKIRAHITSEIETETSLGKRLIAVGYVPVTYDDIPEDDVDSLLSGLVFAGVVVLDDPVREGVKDSIMGVKSAGAEILLITGDNPKTALSIAEAVGIVGSGAKALTGSELSHMTDEEILAAIADVKVFARVLPRQKMRLAMILQQKGEIVAMTGDGINDAPALRRANIGIAIGSGTEVAKEASDLVLVNDSFSTIYAAIEEGRRIIANLRKIVGYLLSTSLSEVVLVAAAILTGAAVPILPAQILWANVIEEGLMSVAFAFEKGEKNSMKRKPQDIHEEGILSKDMMVFMAFVVTVLSVLTLSLYFYLRSLDISLEELRSAMFLSISIDSLFMAFAFRSLTTPVWKIPLRTNLFFLGSFAVSVSLLAIVLTVPFFQKILSYTPLPMFDILLVIGFSFAALAMIELSKWLFFERRS
ncbi:MAG: Ca2+-transporting ATPase [Candidatus Azotimanducaceae bacterium]|jgi:Ca2+-transporting ATPase